MDEADALCRQNDTRQRQFELQPSHQAIRVAKFTALPRREAAQTKARLVDEMLPSEFHGIVASNTMFSQLFHSRFTSRETRFKERPPQNVTYKCVECRETKIPSRAANFCGLAKMFIQNDRSLTELTKFITLYYKKIIPSDLFNVPNNA